jgi:hypothetical protein
MGTANFALSQDRFLIAVDTPVLFILAGVYR